MPGRHRRPPDLGGDSAHPLLAGACVLVALAGVFYIRNVAYEPPPAADTPLAIAEPQDPPVPPQLRPPEPARVTATPSRTKDAAPATTTTPKPKPSTSTSKTPTPAPSTTKTSTSAKPTPTASAKKTAAPAGSSCSRSGFGGVKPHVAAAGHHLADRFGVDTVLGVAGRSGPSDHPLGLALDFMVDRATGDALAAYVLDHQDELAVTYVIWRQRINHGSGWSPMEDRGGITANHYDHVHVSFEPTAGSGLPC